jgi:protein phosphatase 1 regulatory subunit 21
LQEKLIQDYVKLKSKLNILKKAYVDLTDSSAQKDQSLRKYEQEIEGLNFRNQQMTARVEMLQREIDSLKINNSSTSNDAKSNGTNQDTNSPNSLSNSGAGLSSSTTSNLPPIEIVAEELQHKINENTSLHRSLNELEAEFRQKLSKTEQILRQTENEKFLIEKKL